MVGTEIVWKLLCVVSGNALFEVIVTKVPQPPLDVLLQSTELPFNGTNSMMSSIQNNALHLFHTVLASNRLGTYGFLTVSKYRCQLDTLFVGLPLGCFPGISPSYTFLSLCCCSSAVPFTLISAAVSSQSKKPHNLVCP